MPSIVCQYACVPVFRNWILKHQRAQEVTAPGHAATPLCAISGA